MFAIGELIIFVSKGQKIEGRIIDRAKPGEHDSPTSPRYLVEAASGQRYIVPEGFILLKAVKQESLEGFAKHLEEKYTGKVVKALKKMQSRKA